jgi:hypothetical protein
MNALHNTFKYPVSKLLKSVTSNREQHVSDYDEAVINYKKILVEQLEEMLTNAKSGSHVNPHVGLRQPENHIKEYDQAITMLKMTSDKTIEIDGDTFARLVMDDWDWQTSFANNTKVYGSAALNKPGAYASIRG